MSVGQFKKKYSFCVSSISGRGGGFRSNLKEMGHFLCTKCYEFSIEKNFTSLRRPKSGRICNLHDRFKSYSNVKGLVAIRVTLLKREFSKTFRSDNMIFCQNSEFLDVLNLEGLRSLMIC